MKLFLAITMLVALAACEGDLVLNYKNQQEIMKYLKVVMKKEGLMKCIINRDLAQRPDSKCLIMFNVQKKLEAIVSMISSIVVDVVYKSKACNRLEEKLEEKNCKEVIRLDIRKRFHLEFHSKEEEVFVAKIVTRFFNYLVLVKREREQHLTVDVDQQLHAEKPQEEEESPVGNKILFPYASQLGGRPIEEQSGYNDRAPILRRFVDPRTQDDDEEEKSETQEEKEGNEDNEDDNAIYRNPQATNIIPIVRQPISQKPADEEVHSIDQSQLPPALVQAITKMVENSKQNQAQNNGQDVEEDPRKKIIVLRGPNGSNEPPRIINGVPSRFEQDRVLPEVKQTSVIDNDSQKIQL